MGKNSKTEKRKQWVVETFRKYGKDFNAMLKQSEGEVGNESEIYCIVNMLNWRIYIGKTVEFGGRKYKHFYCLQSDNVNHKNPFLQNDWNKLEKGV